MPIQKMRKRGKPPGKVKPKAPTKVHSGKVYGGEGRVGATPTLIQRSFGRTHLPNNNNKTRTYSFRKLDSRAPIINNLIAEPGIFVNARTGQPYSGPMHKHNGMYMIGQRHSYKTHDYLIKQLDVIKHNSFFKKNK